MRVKLGNRIYFCSVATHSKGSDLILLTTSNGVYTVDMGSTLEAESCHNTLLVKEFCDFTEFEYSN